MRVAAAQAHPVWLDKGATTERVVSWIERAANDRVDVLAFPETFLPGYPSWVCRTDGARFDEPQQKQAYGDRLDKSRMGLVHIAQLDTYNGLIFGCQGTLVLGPISNNPALSGVRFCLQSAALGSGPWLFSNGLDCVVGNV